MIKKIFVDFVAAKLSTDKKLASMRCASQTYTASMLHNQMLTYRCFLVIS